MLISGNDFRIKESHGDKSTRQCLQIFNEKVSDNTKREASIGLPSIRPYWTVFYFLAFNFIFHNFLASTPSRV
jgi:hypothetical protein